MNKILLFLFFLQLHAETHLLTFEEKQKQELICEFAPERFQELTLHWNGARPKSGRYTFLISLRQNNEWSPWIYYGEWGAVGQIMFRDAPQHTFARSDEGVMKVTASFCDGARVHLIASGGADLKEFTSLSALTEHFGSLSSPSELFPILLDAVPRQSQITLRHPRYLDLSLPVSMTILLNHFFQAKRIDPNDFAAKVIDDETAFYENWSLNIAEASHRLNGAALVQFAHLPDFAALHALLCQGCPVIASISGWLPGSPRPFRTEHALCVIGFDSNKVICIDPAFPNDQATLVSYDLNDFLKGWAKHRNKAVYLSSGGVLLK